MGDIVLCVEGDCEPVAGSGATATRAQIKFYGSTPQYRDALDRVDLPAELKMLSKQGGWQEMSTLIDDEVIRPVVRRCSSEVPGSYFSCALSAAVRVMTRLPCPTPQDESRAGFTRSTPQPVGLLESARRVRT